MEINLSNIEVIGFDADDTLWVNETYFREAETQFAKILSQYETENKIDQELFKMQINNLNTYGYGIKGFMLSMIESALKISNYQVSPKTLEKILNIGKDMISRPVELIDSIEEVLNQLSKKYKLILVTKGDLLDQERKLENSGLINYFHHIEVVSEKEAHNYLKLLEHLEINPENFLMIGNSLKSDVLPLLEIGSQAVHIPFHTTWIHEEVKNDNLKDLNYKTLSSAQDLLNYLD